MASTIKIDTVTTPDGTGNITFSRPIVGDGSGLTGITHTPADNSVTAGKIDLSMTQGDLVYGTGADAWAKLAKGTASQTLKMNAGATAPEWVTVSSSAPTYVQFPAGQVSSADVNRLDDYEEGTFQPDLIAATNNNHVRHTRWGFYTKIGNLITCTCHFVHYGAGSSSGNTAFANFPLVALNVSGNTAGVAIGYGDSLNLAAAGYNITARMLPGAAQADMYTWDAVGGGSRTQFSELGDYNTWAYSVTYMVAT